MIIKVLPNRISHKHPELWELIKFAATSADGIKPEENQAYLNELLHALLCERAQCFLKTNKEQTIVKAVIITRLSRNKITEEKFLLLQCYYSFEKSTEKDWAENMAYAMEFAKQEGCSFISFESNNSRIIKLAEFFGFRERNRCLDYRFGG